MHVRRLNIIGAGSLGSFSLFLTAKMIEALGDPELVVWDFDVIEAHNWLNQLYRQYDIVGAHKVMALKVLLRFLTQVEIKPRMKKVDADTFLQGIVITLVDNMKAREQIFEACQYNYGIPYYIEARSGGDGATVYGFDPRDPDYVNRYKKTLYSDAGAIPAPCASQLTIPTLFLVAACINRMLVMQLTERPKPGLAEIHIDVTGLPGIAPKIYNSYNP